MKFKLTLWDKFKIRFKSEMYALKLKWMAKRLIGNEPLKITLPQDVLNNIDYCQKIFKDPNYVSVTNEEKDSERWANELLERLELPVNSEVKHFLAEVYLRSITASLGVFNYEL